MLVPVIIFTDITCTASEARILNYDFRMVVSMVYYGLSLNTDNLGAGSLYVNFLISGLVEFPAYTICILLLGRVGRKVLHCGSMILGGVSCLLTTFTVLYLDKG